MPENPFGDNPYSGKPSDQNYGSDNPYAVTSNTAPVQSLDPNSGNDPLLVPALGLMITAIVGLILLVLGISLVIVKIATSSGSLSYDTPTMSGLVFNLFFYAFQSAVHLFVIYGTHCMRERKNFPIAIATAIVSLIPFIGICCLTGLPFGIWALIVLSKPEVRDLFSKQPKSVQGPN